jgi:hypothetical protein
MKRLAMVAAVVALVGLAGAVRAEDKPNPTGTWKYSVERNGQQREMTFKLKLDGDKLTGSIPGRNNQETAIEDGKFDKKTGEVSFSVTRERNGQKTTTKYSGKITGDTFKGKTERDNNGQTQTSEFEAKRAKDA